jgi:hypothetical protein
MVAMISTSPHQVSRLLMQMRGPPPNGNPGSSRVNSPVQRGTNLEEISITPSNLLKVFDEGGA